MSLQSRREYLAKIRGRYKRAGRRHKTVILEEFCANCGYHRKHALRLVNGKGTSAKERPGPKALYDEEVVQVLKRLWLESDQLCSKRLVSALPLWMPFLKVPLARQKQMRGISAATIDRLLRPFRAEHRRKRLGGTKPGRWLKQQIPIRTSNWDIKQAGFIEADTVAHGGDSMEGNFIWTLTFTDVCTGWTQCRAVWNKGASGIQAQIKRLEEELPFQIQAFDCDNGSEFLNHALWGYFTRRKQPCGFTRSRPNHKNDNAHVEQKNWTHVRQLFGYERLDQPELVVLMNEIYSQEWHWFQNFFCPTMKLEKKKRMGARYHRVYEKARTPYARLMQSREVSAEQKALLRATFEGLNPLKLKERLEQKLSRAFRMIQKKQSQAFRPSIAGVAS